MPSINVNIGERTTDSTKNVMTARAELNAAFAKISGNADSKISNHPGDSIQFIGISEKGLEVYIAALDKYILKIQEVLQGFNSNANLDNAFAGPHKDAAHNFVQSAESLLSKYVATLRIFRSEASKALANYKSASTQIATKVYEDAAILRKSASGISLDGNDTKTG